MITAFSKSGVGVGGRRLGLRNGGKRDERQRGCNQSRSHGTLPVVKRTENWGSTDEPEFWQQKNWTPFIAIRGRDC